MRELILGLGGFTLAMRGEFQIFPGCSHAHQTRHRRHRSTKCANCKVSVRISLCFAAAIIRWATADGLHCYPKRSVPLGIKGGADFLLSSAQCNCAGRQRHRTASVLVLGLRTTPVYDITHIVEYKDRKSPHALPLFGTKRFVEWLPRLGEFIQIG